MENSIKIEQIDKKIIKKRKNPFLKKEKENNKTVYHMKVVTDIHKWGIDTKKNACRVSFRELYDQTEIQEIRLYSIKKGDKFLGIFYGYRKPIKNVFVRYTIDGVKKAYSFSKTYYIEFRFKTGSVFCYLKGMRRLIKKEKIDTPYNKALVDRLMDLEKHVYEFYNKKYSGEGLIIKWILKNLK
ncbi:DUF226 domain-containing protein [Borreliella kurtenbachii]|uniref:DUF226 domain-containing protein n=1 Tax=Borreliella kurtenbachii TaxID=1196056 RepID=UPI003462D343